MQVKVDFGNLKLDRFQEHVVARKVKRLGRLCKMFKPDLVNLQIVLSKVKAAQGFVTHLKLSVPHRQMVGVGRSKKFSLAVGQAFDKVTSQFRKYRARLKKGSTFAKVAKERGKA